MIGLRELLLQEQARLETIVRRTEKQLRDVPRELCDYQKAMVKSSIIIVGRTHEETGNTFQRKTLN